MIVKHIFPLNDLREHTLTPCCWCKPSVRQHQPIKVNGQKTSETRLVHHAADGRQLMDGEWACAVADEEN